MGILDTLRRRRAATDTPAEQAEPPAGGALPDPAEPPARRGTWEQAALVNVDITEVVKRQIGTLTPPWKK